MIFRPYYYFDLGCAAYLFGCGTLGKGTVVDARADDVEAYIAFAATKGLRLTHVIDTHVHADHRSGGRELARRVDATYCVHESADVTFPFTALRNGDEIELGNTRVKVLHTPGHSPDSVCLVVTKPATLNRRPAVRLCLRENVAQFTLLVIVNAFVGAMVGMERSILPTIGEHDFHLVARAAVLSFIVVFGVTKALTNYAAGRLADRVGRKQVLVAGWALAIPVPFILMWAPSWN